MYKTISKCRLCGSLELETVMSLGEQYLTGVFPKTEDQNVIKGPINLVRCTSDDGCGLVQMKETYSLDEMYGLNYGYRSGLNPSMVKHLESKISKILEMNILREGDVVLDIGSNDSTTLQCYPNGKYKQIGIDPTGIKFSEYYPPEIKLIIDFFTAEAMTSELDGEKVKVVTSISMFYDLEEPLKFALDVESILHDEGIWFLEQSYLPSMLKTNSFDTICHEHLEFYALTQINWIAEKAGLKIIDVEFNDINGGSFSVTVAKKDSHHIPNKSLIENILREEDELGLRSSNVYEEFTQRVEESKNQFLDFLTNAKQDGKRVTGLAASTKGNVLLQYYGIDRTLISEIGEINPDKFSCFTPGSLIPLISEQDLLASNPDYIVILPWHYRNHFLNNPKLKGQTLVFPLPELEVITL